MRSTLIIGDAKGNLYFTDPATGKQIKTLAAHGAAVSGLQFNSTGKLLISNTYDGEIKIYDFEKEKIIQSIFSPDYSGIRFVIFSIADGFIYFNGLNRMYKTRSDLTQPVQEIFSEQDSITDAVITSDRSSLIYSTSNKLKVMNTRTDVIRQEISVGEERIEKLALVGDTMLASWSSNGTIAFWHYTLGEIEMKPVFSFRAGTPSQMNFSADGKWMTTGNVGNWARVWEPMEKNVFQELFGHKETVTSTAFGKNDSLLFTGGADGKLILWKKGAPVYIPPLVKINPVVSEIAKPLATSTIVISPLPPKIEFDSIRKIKTIKGREIITSREMRVKKNKLHVYVYDNSAIDGDTMSLFFDGNWVLDHYGVEKKKKELFITLKETGENYLVLFANNLGKSPPNTAVVEIDDGSTRKIFRLSSDLKTCSAINFVYKP